MSYRDIAIEAVNVTEVFSDCMAILLSGRKGAFRAGHVEQRLKGG